MKVVLSFDFKDTIFDGEDRIASERDTIYKRLNALAESVPEHMWRLEPVDFLEELVVLYHDEPVHHCNFLAMVHKHVKPAFMMHAAMGVVIENIEFKHLAGIVVVHLNTLATLKTTGLASLRKFVDESNPTKLTRPARSNRV